MNFFEITLYVGLGSLFVALLLTVIVTADLGLGFYSETLENLREKYHILRYIWIIAFIIFVVGLGINIVASPKDSKYRNRSQYVDDDKGYWGSDGYYNPSKSEMDQYIRDAKEWIDNN